MCVAILKPKGKDISDKQLELGYEANSHGAGFAYSFENRLVVKKGYFDIDEFIKEIRAVQESCDNPTMIIHFRLASHGVINVQNCHPFNVSENLAVIHNGIMPQPFSTMASRNSTHSDTYYFVEKYLKALYAKDSKFFLDSNVMVDIAKQIERKGRGNKLCFLDNAGEYSIINENLGFFENGVWFSNDSCRVAN
ncbi:hypothetical protein DCO58_04770 [Helicobacter saguini]|uniref:Glutamine amidotransferase type-2 domain-containing protein n=1 Tax=Helicobacter saguini TaxID=1548018 RepID=A0A347VSW6_9HELI|nr:hypothetical protein [Helicobacter saguini]MWV62337.1 hypothetical protein [Helicobacter saguini]MWV66992.1 hypothetical protein [Helicobacter saguini]MWV69340.1 hypothetical protein [Helicobacter saguini]MWV71105.1 hypothetical protein [Helicobacter saguini]TLD94999.1 hypothetical protein LS64_003535 [Helicobacter saguini]